MDGSASVYSTVAPEQCVSVSVPAMHIPWRCESKCAGQEARSSRSATLPPALCAICMHMVLQAGPVCVRLAYLVNTVHLRGLGEWSSLERILGGYYKSRRTGTDRNCRHQSIDELCESLFGGTNRQHSQHPRLLPPLSLGMDDLGGVSHMYTNLSRNRLVETAVASQFRNRN